MPDLVEGVAAVQRLGDLAVDRGHRLAHALAGEPALVAVAQLDRLAGAGGGPRGHGRPAACAALERRHRPRRSGCPGCRRSPDGRGACCCRSRWSMLRTPPGSRCDPEQVGGGAGDAERHAGGDRDDVARPGDALRRPPWRRHTPRSPTSARPRASAPGRCPRPGTAGAPSRISGVRPRIGAAGRSRAARKAGAARGGVGHDRLDRQDRRRLAQGVADHVRDASPRARGAPRRWPCGSAGRPRPRR